jgi:hypothetical protein
MYAESPGCIHVIWSFKSNASYYTCGVCMGLCVYEGGLALSSGNQLSCGASARKGMYVGSGESPWCIHGIWSSLNAIHVMYACMYVRSVMHTCDYELNAIHVITEN